MTTALLPVPIFRAFDTAGNPLAGGLLYTYAANTLTPQTTWSDYAGSTPNTNPVVLDTTGSATVRLDPTLAYKFVLKDASGTTQWTEDYYGESLFLTASTIGAALYPQTSAESAAGVMPTNYAYAPFDLRRYGADPTGVANSDTALTSAIAVCGSTGGTILAPAGNYTFASQIVLDQKNSIIVQGDGTATGGAQSATRFTYSGTASPWISMLSAVGCQFRGVQLYHSNASFTGTYIKCGNDGSHGDPNYCGVFDATMGSSLSNTVHLDLDKCTTWGCENVNFLYGNPSVKGQNSAGGSYSNVVSFKRCYWHQSNVAPVQDGGQAWVFEGCNFEPLAGGNAGALLSNNTTAQWTGLSVRDCWCGDNSGGGNWFDIAGQGFDFRTNYVGGSATSTAFNLKHVHGFVAECNTLSTQSVGFNFADSTMGGIRIAQNILNSVTTALTNPTNVPAGQLDCVENFGIGVPTGHGSLGNNGYIVFPNGVIHQWGTVAVTSGTPVAVAFNVNGINFPNACYNVIIGFEAVGTAGNTAYADTLATTGFNAKATGTGANTLAWFAIGH